jgi:hypothetical protein
MTTTTTPTTTTTTATTTAAAIVRVMLVDGYPLARQGPDCAAAQSLPTRKHAVLTAAGVFVSVGQLNGCYP